MTKKFSLPIIVFILLFTVLAFWGVKEVEKQRQQNQHLVQQQTQDQNSSGWDQKSLDKEVNTNDWQDYRNKEYNFKLKYPESWELVVRKIDPNTKDSAKAFFFQKNNKVYFAVLPQGGLGYGITEPIITYEKFKDREAKMLWYGHSFPSFIYITERIPKNWSAENRIEVRITDDNKDDEEIIAKMYEEFEIIY